jgi:hypothetical protein
MSTSDEWLDTPANRAALLTILRQVRAHLVKGSFVTLRLTLQIQDGAIQRDMMVEPVYKVRVPDAAGGAGN